MRALLRADQTRRRQTRLLVKRLGVSRSTVTCARRVLARSPRLANAVAAGRLSIYAAGVRLGLWSRKRRK